MKFDLQIITVFVCLIAAIENGFTQTIAVENNFRNPVDHDIILSGSFGELRGTHFHSGIDIKTKNGKIGDPVIAVADGYISRIKVESTGFGQALYIDHPNGYTSVYAHLDSFNDKITEYVRNLQYSRESFELDHYPRKNRLTVCKGDWIGRIGNKGSSYGPHLHFEIRKTLSENPLNPMLFGIQPKDNQSPIIESLKMYYLNDELETVSEKEIRVYRDKSDPGKYFIPNHSVTSPVDKVNFGIKIFDRMDGSSNRNGVYAMEMYINSELNYSWVMDQISFAESHLIKAHIDYAERTKTRRYFTNCYKPGRMRLNIFQNDVDHIEYIPVTTDKEMDITIKLRDFHNNESKLSFSLSSRDDLELIPVREFDLTLLPGSSYSYGDGLVRIAFPSNSVLVKCGIEIHSSQTEKPDEIHVKIGDPGIALINPMTVTFPGIFKKDEHTSKYTVVMDSDGSIINFGGYWSESGYRVILPEFGNFRIMRDTVPPDISPVSFSENMQGHQKISFKITDNLSPSSRDERLTYRGEIDGRWVLFEYDQKNDLLTYTFDDRCLPGDHKLTLQVSDIRGNATKFSGSFRN